MNAPFSLDTIFVFIKLTNNIPPETYLNLENLKTKTKNKITFQKLMF